MSLTLSTKWTEKTIIKENWLFHLYYADESQADFYGLSYYDTIVDSVDYKGCVLNKATIRESIDLESSTAKTSNVNLTIANFIDENGTHFSKQLLNGTNDYINRTVKIYIQPDDDVDLSDCVQIYTGRLEQVSHTVDKINLSIVAQRPWDKISIPNQDDRTTNNIYKPVVYGDYLDSGTEGSGDDIYGTYIAHPAKYCTEIDRVQYYLTGAGSNGSKGALYWDKFLQKFSPIDDSSSTISTILGQRALQSPVTSDRSNHFWLDSVRVSPQSPVSDATWVNTANIFLTDGYAYLPVVTQSSGTTIQYLYLNCPNIDGEATELSFVVNTRCNKAVGGSSSVVLQIYYENDATQLGYKSYSSDETAIVTANFLTEYGNQNKKMPNYVTLKISWTGAHTGTTDAFRVFEARFETEYKYPDLNDDKDNKTQNFVYSGADGQLSTTDSSAITEIHEAHLDILRRYTSYSGTPTNYSSGTDLNGSKDWKIRYWITEQKPLIDVLEKLAYEGGFIGRFNGQGDYQYIYLPDDPSASATLDFDDITDLNVSSTSVNSLTTRMEIEYEKHPAESKYMNSSTSVSGDDATLLADYNIQATENIKNIKLDAYVSPTMNTTTGAVTTKNDCWFRYYEHILGSPRIIISFTVVNLTYMGLDVGDLIELGQEVDSTILAFGNVWGTYVFMITDVNRSPGILKITAREI